MKLKFKLERFIKFEYWSFWFFYFPFTLQWLFYSIRSLSFVYFTRVNYKTPFGAFFQYSKYQMTQNIDANYLPQTIFFQSKEEVTEKLDNALFNSKFIYKPDVGERGVGVAIYYSLQDWEKTYKNCIYPCMIQEYIDYPIELGILFYKYPSGKKGIFSIVGKKFLEVTGNGKDTLESLILNEIRAATRINFLKSKFSTSWNSIIPEEKKILLEEIGNHNRGTTFLNYNHLINDQLVEVIAKITENIEGFHYGRLDLKCLSLEDLYNGKNIKIIEVNGAASEAAHIYDPNMSLIEAYRDVFLSNRIVFKISQELKKLHIKTPNTLVEFINAWLEHRKKG